MPKRKLRIVKQTPPLLGICERCNSQFNADSEHEVKAAFVGLGCIGEFIAEFTSLPKCEQHKHKIAKLSLMVLILGIAGELLSTARTSQLSGLIIADIEEQAKDAEQKAEEANQKGESEHLARVQLEKSMEWRRLSDSQKRALCSIFLPSGANESMILSSPEDPEAWSYASEFAEELRNCQMSEGFGPSGHLGRQYWSSNVIFGVWVRFSKSPNPSIPLKKRLAMARSLADKLTSIGVKIEGISNEEPAGIVFPYLYVGPKTPPHAEQITKIPASKSDR